MTKSLSDALDPWSHGGGRKVVLCDPVDFHVRSLAGGRVTAFERPHSHPGWETGLGAWGYFLALGPPQRQNSAPSQWTAWWKLGSALALSGAVAFSPLASRIASAQPRPYNGPFALAWWAEN
ncbi:hypothetical protein CGC21_18875 [Leishmania donovani]|uniref:Uncharacterized protein n=1 Tax=Leishmania donovani TaxID=5661 RepID=A0A504XR64_LEIDO|nr:hypothetical protein CGC21_18875 [Leishmania donovani]